MIVKFMITFFAVMTASMAVFSLLLFSLIDYVGDVTAISIASSMSVITIVVVDRIVKPWIY